MLKNENPFQIASEAEFSRVALSVFRRQALENPVYAAWLQAIRVDAESVNAVEEIPFLPIEFFKTHKVVCGTYSEPEGLFRSSTTTSSTPSVHLVKDLSVYEQSFSQGFRLFYGKPEQYCILALLPGYLERQDSSLVYMFNGLIAQSGHPDSGFYLNDLEKLRAKIEELKRRDQKTLLLGVSYALLDLAATGIKLSDNFIVMETGGMKGKRAEMLKPELHAVLRQDFGVNQIHSEYGMTELLSQAYSFGDGLFSAPPWMRFLLREVDDPFQLKTDGRTGGINVIDLANLNSCAFIATSDLGRLHPGGKLELMGRFDHSDVRGCNLMIGS